MRELKEDFIGKGEVKGFEFTQLKKTEKGYIYSVNKGESIHFEVFKHKYNKRFDCISYPKTRSFGVWAWTVGTFEDACVILNSFE